MVDGIFVYNDVFRVPNEVDIEAFGTLKMEDGMKDVALFGRVSSFHSVLLKDDSININNVVFFFNGSLVNPEEEPLYMEVKRIGSFQTVVDNDIINNRFCASGSLNRIRNRIYLRSGVFFV